jgi:hypothetical protein
MFPFACNHSRAKRIKANFSLEKDLKTEERKESFSGS